MTAIGLEVISKIVLIGQSMASPVGYVRGPKSPGGRQKWHLPVMASRTEIKLLD